MGTAGGVCREHRTNEGSQSHYVPAEHSGRGCSKSDSAGTDSAWHLAVFEGYLRMVISHAALQLAAHDTFGTDRSGLSLLFRQGNHCQATSRREPGQRPDPLALRSTVT